MASRRRGVKLVEVQGTRRTGQRKGRGDQGLAAGGGDEPVDAGEAGEAEMLAEDEAEHEQEEAQDEQSGDEDEGAEESQTGDVSDEGRADVSDEGRSVRPSAVSADFATQDDPASNKRKKKSKKHKRHRKSKKSKKRKSRRRHRSRRDSGSESESSSSSSTSSDSGSGSESEETARQSLTRRVRSAMKRIPHGAPIPRFEANVQTTQTFLNALKNLFLSALIDEDDVKLHMAQAYGVTDAARVWLVETIPHCKTFAEFEKELMTIFHQKNLKHEVTERLRECRQRPGEPARTYAARFQTLHHDVRVHAPEINEQTMILFFQGGCLAETFNAVQWGDKMTMHEALKRVVELRPIPRHWEPQLSAV